MAAKKTLRRLHNLPKPVFVAIETLVVFVCSIIFSVAGCLIANTIFPESDQNATDYLRLGETAAAAIAAGLVVLELRGNKETEENENAISESTFIRDSNSLFITDDSMKSVESSLEQHAYYGDESKMITDANRQDFINYLVYLEGLAPLILMGTITLEHIDDLFAYRFFLAVNNREMQEDQLHPFASYYRGCYRLYKIWKEYRICHGLSIPGIENSLDQWELFSIYADPTEITIESDESRKVTQRQINRFFKEAEISQINIDGLKQLFALDPNGKVLGTIGYTAEGTKRADAVKDLVIHYMKVIDDINEQRIAYELVIAAITKHSKTNLLFTEDLPKVINEVLIKKLQEEVNGLTVQCV